MRPVILALLFVPGACTLHLEATPAAPPPALTPPSHASMERWIVVVDSGSMRAPAPISGTVPCVNDVAVTLDASKAFGISVTAASRAALGEIDVRESAADLAADRLPQEKTGLVRVRGHIRSARAVFVRDGASHGTATVVLAAEIQVEEAGGRRLAAIVEAKGAAAAYAHCLDAATLVRRASEQALGDLAAQIGARLAPIGRGSISARR